MQHYVTSMSIGDSHGRPIQEIIQSHLVEVQDRGWELVSTNMHHWPRGGTEVYLFWKRPTPAK